jgi:DNA-binding PadR family transcriptional regulator
MDDLIKTIKLQLYERASSPLLFSFSISWIAWNYRWLLIVASSLPPSDKTLLIDQLSLRAEHYGINSNFYWLIWGLLGPTLTALSYIYIYPMPARKVYEYTRRQQKALKELQTQIDDDTPLTREDARELRRSLKIALEDSEKEIVWRDEQISSLKKDLDELRSGVESSKIKSDEKSEDRTLLHREAENLLLKLALNRYVSQRGTWLNGLEGSDYIKMAHHLEKLLALNFLSEDYDDEDQQRYISVTPKGHAYLVDNNLLSNNITE